jgi:hypothetical protein
MMDDIERSANAMKGVFDSREEWAENLKKVLEGSPGINSCSLDSIRAKGEKIVPNKDRLAGAVTALLEPTEEYADALVKRVTEAIAKLPKENPCAEMDLLPDDYDYLSKMTNAGFIADTLEEFAEIKSEMIRDNKDWANLHDSTIQRWADMEAKGAQTIRELIEELRHGEAAQDQAPSDRQTDMG